MNHIRHFWDQQSVQSKSKPSQNKEKWVDKLNNKYWKPFFENYSSFLGEDFIKSYGYDPISGSNSNKVLIILNTYIIRPTLLKALLIILKKLFTHKPS